MTTPLTITSMDQGKIAPRATSDETYWAHFRTPQKPEPANLPQRSVRQLFRVFWPLRGVLARW